MTQPMSPGPKSPGPKAPGPCVHEDAQVFSDTQVFSDAPSREAALDELRRLIAEGDASGPSRPFDVEAFLGERRREIGE